MVLCHDLRADNEIFGHRFYFLLFPTPMMAAAAAAAPGFFTIARLENARQRRLSIQWEIDGRKKKWKCSTSHFQYFFDTVSLLGITIAGRNKIR